MLGKTNAGGMSLNFKIDAYATKNILLADSPKRNTIGVVTRNDITSYIFSPSEPAVPTPGMVWIATGSSSPGTFNAIKKNVVQVSPLYAKQYIGGKWAEVEAMSYIDGVWLDWFKYLYNKGDECVELTGGWKAYPYKTSGSGSTASTPSVTKGSSTIRLSLGDLKAGALFTEKPIDLTDISSLSINVIGVSDSKDTGFLLITKSKKNNYTRDAGVKITNTGLVTLDVSDYKGQYYVAVNLQGTGKKYIEFDRISTRGGSVGGGGHVVLEAKTVTPTKDGFDVKPTPGMALSMVTINPIPNKYQDVSGVTAQEEHVLNGYFFVDSSGTLREGSLTDEKEPAVIQSLTVTENGTYTLPAGVDGYAPVTVNVPQDGQLPSISQDVLGTAEDLAEGKQLISADGNIVDGKVKPGDRYFYQYLGGVDCFFEDGAVCFQHTFDKNAIYRSGQSIELYGSDLGNADASHVEKGWTFTSENGLKIEGELEVGVQLPTIDDNALGTAEDLAAGKQLIGANGEIVTGTLAEEKVLQIHENVSVETDDGTIEMVAPVYKDAIVRQGSYSRLIARASDFGDAGPADVRSGKTFTSKEGVCIPGELEVGVQLPSIAQNVIGTAEDLVQGKQLIGADGTVVTGKMPDRGDVQVKIDGLTTTSYTIPAGRHNGSGTVSLTKDIENIALEQAALIQDIKTALAGKAAGSGGAGSVIKTGTTSSNTINTGLSDVEQFFMYKAYHEAAGLILLHYSKANGTSRLYSTVWTSYSKNVNSGKGGVSINGGTVTIEETTPANGGLSSNVTYTWVAAGTE